MPFVPGNLTFRLLGTCLIHMIMDHALTKVDHAAEVGRNIVLNAPGNGPRFRSNGSFTYNNGRFSATLQMAHVSARAYDGTYGTNGILDSHVADQTYFNLSARYAVNEQLGLFGVVTHLFSSGIHDVTGQRFTIGARMSS